MHPSLSDRKKPIRVAVVIFERNGKFLLCRRARGARYELQWEFPGGKVEAGESVKQCALREIREELSLSDCRVRLLHVKHIAYDDGHTYAVAYFKAANWRGRMRNRVFDRIGWFSPEEMLMIRNLQGNREIIQRLALESVRNEANFTSVRTALHRWYKHNGRDLPWRRTRSPYTVLLSEIMLQQTQVQRVTEKLPLFRKEFPSFKALALARRSDVVKAWAGLGYNNRAVRLHELASIVVRDYSGRLPKETSALRSLPGIGAYTAAAISCFAHGLGAAPVDVNIKRVYSRLLPDIVKRFGIGRTANFLLDAEKPYEWNQALMDLGALVCTASSPKCGDCPLQKFCPSAFRIARTKSDKRKSEPSFNGVPNRIYRGRIVQLLRKNRRMSLSRIGVAITETSTFKDYEWLRKLAFALERDGVVIVRRNGSAAKEWEMNLKD